MIGQGGLEDTQQAKFTYCYMSSTVPTPLKFMLINFFIITAKVIKCNFVKRKVDQNQTSAEGIEKTQLL